MTNGSPHRVSGRLIAGVLLILVGVLFTLDTFGVLHAGDLFEYWPLILVGVGLAKIFGRGRGDQRFAGAVIAAIGLLLLLRTLDVFWFRLRDLWPIVLLLIGGAMVWRSFRGRRWASPGWTSTTDPTSPTGSAPDASAARSGTLESGDVLHEFAFMGGGDRVVRSQQFQGGEVTAVLGGFKIDLRGAAIAGESAALEVFAFWGGVEIRVPENWNVSVQGTPILGAFVNRTGPGIGQPPGKTFIIRGSVVMGGVEVKN